MKLNPNPDGFPLLAVSRLRMGTDGQGVTTLVAARGCPLRCRYCINRECWEERKTFITPEALYEQVRIDDLYFRATGGGVTFGGGEPLMYAGFIQRFRTLCGEDWKLRAETSLNVPDEQVRIAAQCVDEFIVDIKDMDPGIYRAYTGEENLPVMENLRLLTATVGPARILVRLPLIPGYNTADDREASCRQLMAMGLTRFERFEYVLR